MGESASAAIADVLTEFIEAVVHQLLFVRRLYAEELFERQRLYGIAVRRSRHPALNEYIHEAVASLRDCLLQGTLHKLAVVVRKQDGTPAERFVIEPRVLASTETVVSADLESIESIQAQLRGALLKLQYSDSYLAKLPPGCTFELCVHTSGRSGVDTRAWVEEQNPQRLEPGGAAPCRAAVSARAGPGLELGAAEIMPIKSCYLEGAFQLQLYAEH